MKKFTLTLILLSAISFLASAQITVKPGGGFHYMELNRSAGIWDRFGGIGFQMGSTALIGRRIYFETGVFWQKNFSEFSQIDDGNTGPVRISHDLSLLYVPVLGGFSLLNSDGSSLDVRVFAGPAFHIPLQVVNSDTHVDAPLKSDYSGVFWGGNVGFSFTWWWLFLDASYEFGFSNVYKDTVKFGPGKANTFFINFGVRIRL